MRYNHLYTYITKSMLPEYPAINRETKILIAEKASLFIAQQFSNQPRYLSYLLQLIGFMLAIGVLLFGARTIILFRRLPYGALVERLFRSLVVLVFLEDKVVLSALEEPDGVEKITKFRKLRLG